jgi:shikimate dehydrogenase
MPTLGLIGFPLAHSNSPKIFHEFFQKDQLIDWSYRLFPIENFSEFRQWLSEMPDLRGFNVTIPHKQNIMEYLDHISPEAAEIGAVNTVSVKHINGRISLHGYNTDAYGFEKLLFSSGKALAKNALVLGTGGSSKAVCSVLKKHNIDYTLVSSSKKENILSYDQITKEITTKNKIIINTTPLGMHPKIELMPPFPIQWIGNEHLVLDLIYNPSTTRFMAECSAQGATVMNGAIMLQKQAEKAWEIFKQS